MTPAILSFVLDVKLSYQGELTWKLMELKGNPSVYYWQPSKGGSGTPSQLDPTCPVGMVRVKGDLLDPLRTVPLQNQACLDGVRWNPKYLCQNFKSDYLQGQAIPSEARDFCIDAYEFPNIPGEYPAVMVSFDSAKALCEAQGKRLCTEDEWSFACEGERALPYPQGFHRYTDPTSSFPTSIRNDEGCNYDRLPGKPFNPRNIQNPKSELAAKELDRSFNGTAAGEQKLCVSDFGVKDLTGNIEEWTFRSKEKPSILKGGYWAPVRARCRLSEDAHGRGHRYYQTGFRCCLN